MKYGRGRRRRPGVARGRLRNAGRRRPGGLGGRRDPDGRRCSAGAWLDFGQLQHPAADAKRRRKLKRWKAEGHRSKAEAALPYRLRKARLLPALRPLLGRGRPQLPRALPLVPRQRPVPGSSAARVMAAAEHHLFGCAQSRRRIRERRVRGARVTLRGCTVYLELESLEKTGHVNAPY